MDFRSSGRYPYTRLVTLAFFAVFFSGLVMLSGIGPEYLLVVAVAILPPLLLFVVSPLMARHSVGPEGLTLRQGWYFRARVPAPNIAELSLTQEDPPAGAISYSARRRRLYLTMSASPLVHVELREAVRLPFSRGRPVQSVVFSVDDAEGVLAAAGEVMNARVVPGDLCPHCRRPMPESPAGPPAAPASPRHPLVEYIFLIHRDGRLVFQFAGGRMRALSTPVVSGMLLVVQDFIRDAFKTEGGALRRLEHGDLTVLIEEGRFTYLAVVVSGHESPEELRPVMKQVVRETEEEFADALRVWDGSPPEGIGKVVSQVLWT
ncbi:MAG: hypothetical protein FJ149_06770 [Euryarchaeota archaeon]|nr:hypothetical protein [Euryarchaeota archaeon]